jgi:hypothetical protein
MFHIPSINETHKMYEGQQVRFGLKDLILLYYGHRHDSATHVAIFRVISLRTTIQL